MKTKIQIKTITGDLLFEFEDEDNSIRHTVEEAVRQNISLSGADLRGADIRGTNLSCADLRGTNLRDANLASANLRDANLRNANIRNADLTHAYFGNTDFRDADLRDADLKDTKLKCAYLDNADFRGAKNSPFMPTYLPEGEFIAWKKLPNGLIAKLKILEDSKRSRATGDKCRCDKCLVLEFQNADGSASSEKTYTNHNYSECTYTVGEVVYADEWDDNRWNECSHG